METAHGEMSSRSGQSIVLDKPLVLARTIGL